METLVDLVDAGLKVKDIIVIVDRMQGGKEFLYEKGYTVHSVFTVSDITTPS